MLRSDSDVDMVKRVETKNKSPERCTTVCVASKDCQRQWEAPDAAIPLQTGRSESLGGCGVVCGRLGAFWV